jgi:polyphosphate kinase
VSIDLIVRGFCTLRPGVAGHEREHPGDVRSSAGSWSTAGSSTSRNGARRIRSTSEFFIGSADWMYRNLGARVEAICPIAERNHRARLWEIINLPLNDRRQAWDMRPDGTYELRSTDGVEPDSDAALGTHELLMRAATASVNQPAHDGSS